MSCYVAKAKQGHMRLSSWYSGSGLPFCLKLVVSVGFMFHFVQLCPCGVDCNCRYGVLLASLLVSKVVADGDELLHAAYYSVQVVISEIYIPVLVLSCLCKSARSYYFS